jgi:hypothetical protein
MNLILCSGNSLRNRDWIVEVDELLRPGYEKTYVQMYKHWQTGDELIDLPHELPILGEAAKQLDEYGVFAKSIGMVLIVQALEQGLISPKFLMLCGVPLGYIVESYPQFGEVLAKANIPVTILHNDHDKVGSYQEVMEYFGDTFANSPHIRIIETEGNTHDYEDYPLITSELAMLQS